MDPNVAAYVARREAALARIRALLIERLRVPMEPDDIDPDTPLFGEGLALDSIDSVDLLIAMKTELGADVPDDHVGRASLRTVNSLVDLALAAVDAQDAGEVAPTGDDSHADDHDAR